MQSMQMFRVVKCDRNRGEERKTFIFIFIFYLEIETAINVAQLRLPRLAIFKAVVPQP
jgi:hypothetical protein